MAVVEVRLVVGLVADLLVAVRLVGTVRVVVAEVCLVGTVRLVGTIVDYVCDCVVILVGPLTSRLQMTVPDVGRELSDKQAIVLQHL